MAASASASAQRAPMSALRTAAGSGIAGEGSLALVGINPGGFAELGASAQQEIMSASVVLGSFRSLHLIPEDIPGEKRPWPSPLLPQLGRLFEELSSTRVVALSSGDPMFHGIGATLRRVMPGLEFTVYPQPSSAQLACARLGWPVAETPVYAATGGDLAPVIEGIERGSRFLVLGHNENTPREIGELLVTLGVGDSSVTVLSDLASRDESITTGSGANPPRVDSSLNVIAVVPSAVGRSWVPGLADDNYAHDGVLLQQHLRALSVCALRPRDHDVLWHIGGGAGSVAIEFLRSTRNARAICFEAKPERQQIIFDNASRLGVRHRIAVQHRAPESFDSVPDTPDVIYIGGGLSDAGVFIAAWQRLRPGGRLVANAFEDERLRSLQARYGGTLTDIAIAGVRAWQWAATKPAG